MKTGGKRESSPSLQTHTLTHTHFPSFPPSLVHHVAGEENRIMCAVRSTANEPMSASEYSLLTRPHLFRIFTVEIFPLVQFTYILMCFHHCSGLARAATHTLAQTHTQGLI